MGVAGGGFEVSLKFEYIVYLFIDLVLEEIERSELRTNLHRHFVRRKRCFIFGSDDYTSRYSRGAVSGTLHGRCRTTALSQLAECFCEDPGNLGDYDYDYDFIQARFLSGAGNPANRACSRGQALRCLAPNGGGGGGGGGFGRSGGGGSSTSLRSFTRNSNSSNRRRRPNGGGGRRGNTDSSAVNFG